MYLKRIQIANYGPIDLVDVTLPFEGDRPQPVVLVGANGSGKSILLSHVVNGLTAAKDLAYPDTPEVDTGRVYKLRDSSYIKSGKDFYFARSDFQDAMSFEEIRSRLLKRQYSQPPVGLHGSQMQSAWSKMRSDNNDHFSSIAPDKQKAQDAFSKNCVLYFPPNRFEDPAWLNEANLRARADYMDLQHMEGSTSRKVINYSSLHDNQNWLFDVIYDRSAFEAQTVRLSLSAQNRNNQPVFLPVHAGYSGDATRIYEIALQIVRSVINEGIDTRFGVGRRLNRVVSVEGPAGQIVPNIFQLSSGETSLLNLFLSILRDFDLSGTSFSTPEEIRGIVVVDEIDLHLHAIHQFEILPALMKLFPRVQFVATSHSPLFVLGMTSVFKETGFGLYRLPSGERISPEEFSEFEIAYRSFQMTHKFADDTRAAIERTQKPVVFMEGTTDIDYVRAAARLLERSALLEKIDLRDGGGDGNLKKIWNNLRLFINAASPQRVVLLFDCERDVDSGEDGKVFRKRIPLQNDHPIQKGIENLFARSSLEKARTHRAAFIDVDDAHTRTQRGEKATVPEKWTVNVDEKSNLCAWLCNHGTADDFQHFRVILDLVEELTGVDGTLTHRTQST